MMTGVVICGLRWMVILRDDDGSITRRSNEDEKKKEKAKGGGVVNCGGGGGGDDDGDDNDVNDDDDETRRANALHANSLNYLEFERNYLWILAKNYQALYNEEGEEEGGEGEDERMEEDEKEEDEQQYFQMYRHEDKDGFDTMLKSHKRFDIKYHQFFQETRQTWIIKKMFHLAASDGPRFALIGADAPVTISRENVGKISMQMRASFKPAPKTWLMRSRQKFELNLMNQSNRCDLTDEITYERRTWETL